VDKSSMTTATLIQADEEILIYAIPDDALERAAPSPLATPRCTTSDTACLSCYPECKVIF